MTQPVLALQPFCQASQVRRRVETQHVVDGWDRLLTYDSIVIIIDANHQPQVGYYGAFIANDEEKPSTISRLERLTAM